MARPRSGALSFARVAVMLPLLSSCGSAVATANAPTVPVGPASAVLDVTSAIAPPIAPTWSMIYERYFAVTTEGACARTHGCHAVEMADAASAYSWLEGRGYIAGTRSPIVSTTNSCLRWFGGNMPPGGKPDPRGADELSAWVAAGAPNN